MIRLILIIYLDRSQNNEEMDCRDGAVGHGCAERGDGNPDMAAEDQREDDEDVEEGAREGVVLPADGVHAADFHLDAEGVIDGFSERKGAV